MTENTQLNPYAGDIVATLEWLGYAVDRAEAMEYPNGNVAVTVILPGSNIHIEDILDGVRENMPTYTNTKSVEIGGHQTETAVTLLAYFSFWY